MNADEIRRRFSEINERVQKAPEDDLTEMFESFASGILLDRLRIKTGHSQSPIHQWFGLSYANYLVLPRTILQSLSVETQLKLVDALDAAYNECSENMEHHWPHEASIQVQLKDLTTGKFIKDDLADYQRGRRRLWKQKEK